MLTPDAPFRVDDDHRREVERLLEEGLLEPLLLGVVGPAGCTGDAEMRVGALAVALPERVLERGVVAQAAAAWVWCGGTPPDVVDVAVPPGRTVPRLTTLAVHERRMPEGDVADLTFRGISVGVTTATRTLVDLLRMLPPSLAPAAVAPLLAVPGVTAAGVHACLERMPRARGVPRARVLAAGLPFGQSMRLPVIR
jgi:hypothetical protein